jgi:hypothetical protein
MLIGKIKKGVVEYSVKYDLSLYSVSLSTKDKVIFFLTPINLALKLSRLEFSAKNAEERAKWYVALTKCMKVNKFDNMSYLNPGLESMSQDTKRINGSEAERLRRQLEAGMTLTDITDFLIKEDMMLQKTINKSNEAFSTLTL